MEEGGGGGLRWKEKECLTRIDTLYSQTSVFLRSSSLSAAVRSDTREGFTRTAKRTECNIRSRG